MERVAWQPLLGLLSWYLVMWSSLCNSFEDWMSVDEGACRLTWLSETDWAHQNSSSSNGHQGGMSYCRFSVSRLDTNGCLSNPTWLASTYLDSHQVVHFRILICKERCWKQGTNNLPTQTAVGSSGLNARWSQGRTVDVKFYSLILNSSFGLSAGIQSAGDLVPADPLGSNPAFSRGRQLVSFRMEKLLSVPEHRN